MSKKIYEEVEAIVLPKMENFHQDLTVFDKSIINSYDGAFLYAFRASGTNIFTLDESKYDYSKNWDQIHNTLSNSLHIIKGNNKSFIFCDGNIIQSIDWERLNIIFGDFVKKVHRRKEYIDTLCIDAIAFELYEVIVNYKSDWIQIVKDSCNETLKSFIRYFDYQKMQLPENFGQTKTYKLSDNEDLKNIKSQLFDIAL